MNRCSSFVIYCVCLNIIIRRPLSQEGNISEKGFFLMLRQTTNVWAYRKTRTRDPSGALAGSYKKQKTGTLAGPWKNRKTGTLAGPQKNRKTGTLEKPEKRDPNGNLEKSENGNPIIIIIIIIFYYHHFIFCRLSHNDYNII